MGQALMVLKVQSQVEHSVVVPEHDSLTVVKIRFKRPGSTTIQSNSLLTSSSSQQISFPSSLSFFEIKVEVLHLQQMKVFQIN